MLMLMIVDVGVDADDRWCNDECCYQVDDCDDNDDDSVDVTTSSDNQNTFLLLLKPAKSSFLMHLRFYFSLTFSTSPLCIFRLIFTQVPVSSNIISSYGTSLLLCYAKRT